MSTLVERLDALAVALGEDRDRPADARETRAPDPSLDAAVVAVRRARDRLVADDRGTASRVMADLARQVGDSWSYSSSLARETLACAQALR